MTPNDFTHATTCIRDVEEDLQVPVDPVQYPGVGKQPGYIGVYVTTHPEHIGILFLGFGLVLKSDGTWFLEGTDGG